MSNEVGTTDSAAQADSPGVSRRKFLGLGGVAAAAMASGAVGLEPLANASTAAGADFAAAAGTGGPDRLRRNASWTFRKEAADYWQKLTPTVHLNNGDEALYPSRIGSYSKGLPHDSYGEVDSAAYQSFLDAIDSGRPEDYDAIIMGGPTKLTNPQSGLAFDLEGADSHGLAVPPPPPIASVERAGEGVELYWMSLMRDVNFLDYAHNADVAAAVADLNSFGADFKGPKRNGAVTAQTLFRDALPGATVGPYVSQFMWMNTPFGVEYVERKMRTALPGTNHLTDYGNWVAAQNGTILESAAGEVDPVRRYVRNARDLNAWVHVDVLFQAYFNACLIMITPPSSDPTFGGLGVPLNPGNPYRNSANQIGFGTFGAPAIKGMMCEVASRALKVTWHKKWQVNRTLRPENWGGLVHNQVTKNRYPGILHPKQLDSPVLDRIHSKYGTYLLPIAFPEGCPTHPSYTAGHATVAGACVTILKALFDESFVIENPVVPTPDGLALVPYKGPTLTVGGELNKLASNIATARNMAGVHWRTDSRESMKVGEALAISILRDQKACYNEKFDGFTFTKFDGSTVTV